MENLEARYFFRKTPLPQDVCAVIAAEIKRLQKAMSKEQYLQQAYDLITTRFVSGRINTIMRLFELFSTSTRDLWNRNGRFVHCTNQNYLLAVLLVKGGRFQESDIILKWTLISYFSPHQYLKVRVDSNRWVTVDCWGRQYGVPYGDHAYGFNSTPFRTFTP
jgi:hypothetical protein